MSASTSRAEARNTAPAPSTASLTRSTTSLWPPWSPWTPCPRPTRRQVSPAAAGSAPACRWCDRPTRRRTALWVRPPLPRRPRRTFHLKNTKIAVKRGQTFSCSLLVEVFVGRKQGHQPEGCCIENTSSHVTVLQTQRARLLPACREKGEKNWKNTNCRVQFREIRVAAHAGAHTQTRPRLLKKSPSGQSVMTLGGDAERGGEKKRGGGTS